MPKKGRGKEQADPEPEKQGEGDAQPQAEQPQVPCPHGSQDGQACCAMDCHVAEVPDRLEALIRRKKTDDDATMQFAAKLKGATMNADGEVTVALIPNVNDPWGLHHRSVSLKGRAVNVTLLFESEQPAASTATLGQQEIPFEGAPKVEPVSTVICSNPGCLRIARDPSEKAGAICMFCALGELIEAFLIPLYCSECRQFPEMSTAQPGDGCTLCRQGRYLAGVVPAIETTADLIRFIPPSRVDEMADAICGLELQNDRIAKAIVVIGDDRFVISEACSGVSDADPATFGAWRAVTMDEFDGDYHEDAAKGLDHMRVTLPESDGVPGAAFVLVGPALRVIVQAEDEPASDEPPEPIEGEAD